MRLLAFTFFLFIQNAPPTFQDVAQKAKQENKPILLVFSGSDWCANCIRLKSNVFEQAAFVQLQEGSFLMYTADFPRDKKSVPKNVQESNTNLAETYNPKGLFPFVVLLDSKLKVLKTNTGKFKTVEALKAWMSL